METRESKDLRVMLEKRVIKEQLDPRVTQDLTVITV